MFPAGSTCPQVLWILPARRQFRLQDSHLFLSRFPPCSTIVSDALCSPNTEDIAILGLASFAFARHYSRNLGWFLFLCLLRCFSSAGSLDVPMYSVRRRWGFLSGVSPFGYPRVKAYLQLTAAFRSLSRPSSAPNAKAFTLCSLQLELPFFCFLVLHEFRKSVVLTIIVVSQLYFQKDL